MTLPSIEKGIPIPPRTGERTGVTDLLRSMEPGDSILLDSPRAARSYTPIMDRLQKKEGLEFTSRTLDDGVRIWRVS